MTQMRPISLIPAGLLATLAFGACSKKEQAKPEPATNQTAPIAATVSAAPAKEEMPSVAIQSRKTLAQAIAFAKPFMEDKFGEDSVGTVALAVWGTKHMVFADVNMAKAETSIAQIMKDVDEERTKRLCLGGSLISISVEKTSAGKVAAGLLMTDAVNLVRFLAVGSSGDLVERMPARLCGVVTGRYDYRNSGGGTGHAVAIVGMFDLPQNRTASAASPAAVPTINAADLPAAQQ